MKKRMLSMFLSVIMVLGLLTITTFADDVRIRETRELPVDYKEEIAVTNGDADNLDYDYITDLLLNDDNISFDSDTQSYLVIDMDAELTENFKSLNIYKAEERIKEYELTFDVSINDTPVGDGYTYYLVSRENNTIETAIVSEAFKMAANSGKIAVFILNKGDTYSASFDIADCYYNYPYNYDFTAWKDENGNFYSGYAAECQPTSGELITEYAGTADEPVTATFSFIWDWTNYIDIEIWMADPINKIMNNPGWVLPEGTTGYINFWVELRDENGNISPLPKTYYNNYGNSDIYCMMQEDGVISVPLNHFDRHATEGSEYGEFDFFIPFGYDYRITLLSYSVDTLGGYAYYYNQDHATDEDGFAVTNKSLLPYTYEDGSFLEFTFMPMNKEIRIEKNVEGVEPQNAEYGFRVEEFIPGFVDKFEGEHRLDSYNNLELRQILNNYPYELYDVETGERIDDGSLKTDDNGHFTMKANQYAVFKTWGLPADFDDYGGIGFSVKDIYDSLSKDISTESRYTVNEVECPDCTTSITHTHNGTETEIIGKKVDNVYGGDALLYNNVFPSYSITYKGNGAAEQDFTDGEYAEGSIAIIKDGSVFTRDGYTFLYWSFSADGDKAYEPYDNVIMEHDITLYAIWTKDKTGGDIPIIPPYRPNIPSKGSVTIVKTDSEDIQTYLNGAKFKIYTDDDDLIGTYTTDENGEITVGDLNKGEYYAVEITPPKGYTLDSSRHNFSIVGGKTTVLSVTNERSEVPEMLNGDDHFAYIIGRDDGLVHPEASITRAEVTTIFFRLLDPSVRDANLSYTNNYTDVSEDMWYNTAISTMTKLGIVNGRTATTFDPNAYITRAEFAAIAARFDESSLSEPADFTDIDDHWAAVEIGKAASNGWVNGYSDGTFKPDKYITRAEAMALINRVLNRAPEDTDDLLYYMVKWPDNMNTAEWYYLDVQEATNSHDYNRKLNGFETWTVLTDVPDWTVYEK